MKPRQSQKNTSVQRNPFQILLAPLSSSKENFLRPPPSQTASSQHSERKLHLQTYIQHFTRTNTLIEENKLLLGVGGGGDLADSIK